MWLSGSGFQHANASATPTKRAHLCREHLLRHHAHAHAVLLFIVDEAKGLRNDGQLCQLCRRHTKLLLQLAALGANAHTSFELASVLHTCRST